MKNIGILVLSIILILILGAIVFVIVMANSNHNFLFDKEKRINNDNRQKAEDSNNLIYVIYNSDYQENSCNSADNLPCFRYSGVEQISSESFKYPRLDQTRLEPCPKPKPVCPLCLEEIKQVREVAHMERIEQTSVSC